jgi:hypothetical protein
VAAAEDSADVSVRRRADRHRVPLGVADMTWRIVMPRSSKLGSDHE